MLKELPATSQELINHYLHGIAVAKRARKPPGSAYWLMPFAIDELYADYDSIFRVWAPTGDYLARPVEGPPALPEAVDEYAGKTVTKATQAADVMWLEQRGLIDASRVSIFRYVEGFPPSSGQPPARTRSP